MDADQSLQEALHARGHRVTPQRVLIHRALRELGRHATADEIRSRVAERLPNASLPTIYAALELFEELGLVRRISAGPGAGLFDPRAEEHHHLVCTRCGAVEDLDTDVDAAAALRAARRRGFRPRGAELVVSGLCARCGSAAPSEAPYVP
jgi:Fe2+ or Zn2+ uptake regulation protein